MEAIFIDACSTEQNNEFIIIHSGGGFNTNNIEIDFDANNNNIGSSNNDINTNMDNQPGAPCGLTNGNISSYTGCTNLISIGPGFSVPANSIVIVQMSSASQPSIYDFTNLCGLGQCVYVISNSCARSAGGFSNNTGNGTRTTVFTIEGCVQSVTYSQNSVPGGNGGFYLPLSGTYGNNGCVVPPSSPATPAAIVNQPADITVCSGDPVSVNFTGTGTSYTWTNSNTNIGLGASGTGNINFTSANVITTQVGTITVTPQGMCPGMPKMFTITVSPAKDASFDFDDFCVGSINGPSNIATPGGTFSFNPNPGGGVTINATTGVISNAVGGSTYSVQYVTTSPCPGTEIVMVNVLANQNANFIFNDFCIDQTNGPTNIITPGGTFSFNPNPGDGATINPLTGVISNPIAGNSYGVQYLTPGPCPNNLTLSVDVLNLVTPILGPFGPYCTSSGLVSLPSTQSGINGIWSGPGIVGNQFNPSVAGPGMHQVTFTPAPGQCASVNNITIEVIESPTGSFSGSPVLCPGECGTVMFSFNGGSGTFDLNLNISAGIFNFNFPMIGVTNNSVLTICLQNGNPFDPATNTLSLPTFVPAGTYTLTLLNFSSVPSGPCSLGTVSPPGFISVTINADPIANPANITLCDFDMNGTEIFDLTSLNGIVTGGNPSNSVTWYSDPGFANQIFNPSNYSASTGTIVYSVVTSSNGCSADNQTLLQLTTPAIPDATDFNICINDPLVNLPLNINGINGTWSGANVFSNQFDPTGLPAGNYPITFTPSGTQCAVPVIVDVVIFNAGPVALPNPIVTSCLGLGVVILGNIQGGVNGVWSGSPFLTGNSFDISASGVGSFMVTFTPVGAMTCFSPNTTQVVVNANTSLNPVTFPSQCPTGGIFDLGGTVQGEIGNWSGNPQVFINLFDPNVTPGTYPLIFTPNNPCVNPLTTSIVVSPLIMLTPPVLGPTCTNGSPIVLPTSVNSINGTWSLGGLPLTVFDPSLTGTGTFTLDFTVAPGFCASSFSTTILVSTITAGFDSLQVSCRTSLNPTINLNTYLSMGTSSGGIWQFNSLPVADPTNVDLSTLSNGPHNFYYIINDAVCGIDTAVIAFDIIPENIAGKNTMQSLCITNAASVNFSALLGMITSGGTWVQPNGVMVDLTDLTDVDLSFLTQGTYDFMYILAPNGCDADTSHTVFNIIPYNSAGNNINTTLCLGATIDLTTIVDGGYTLGNFFNPNAIPGLTDSLWNTAGLSANIYVFQYEAANFSPCPSDTATLTINLASIVTAGQDRLANYCEGSTLVLTDYLSSESSLGGTFYNNGNIVPNGTFNTSGFNLLTFLYIVGDGVTCPRDTSEINLGRVLKPVLTLDPIINICDGDCQSIVVNHNAAIGSNFSFAITSSTGQTYRNVIPVTNTNPLDVTFCASATGPFNFGTLPLNQTFTFRIDSLNIMDGSCRFNYIVTSNFSTKSIPRRNIIRTLCTGKTVTVGGDVYSESNPTGTTTIASQMANQCDSIITVNLTFLSPSPVTNLIETTCDQAYSIKVGNRIFNKANPFGQVTLLNKNGCDSIVNVNLTFSTFSSGTFSFSTCDPTYKFQLGGKTFDITNSSGMVTLIGASVAGCDSLVTVDLEYLPTSKFTFSNKTCDETYSITIGNQTFNKNNPIGNVTLLNKAKNGCDSIVSVILTFIPISIGRNDIATCNDNYSLTVNNMTFNKANPSGSYILSGAAANGCDSLINVQLNFSEFSFVHGLIYACDESDAVFNINLASHPGPYKISVDNIVKSTNQSLPFTSSFAPGTYFVSLETPEGCKDTLTIFVDENSGPLVTLSQTPKPDGTVQLIANAPNNVLYDLSWTPSATLSCSDCYDPIANPTETTTYTFQYRYGNDCTDSRFIIVEKINSEVIIPNIFSPNGDGSNDQFYVKLPDGIIGLIKVMRVYDRWGNLIFNNKDIPPNEPAQGWQGSMNGTFVVPGVYVYYLEIQIDGKLGVDKYSGDITVTR